jgi:hypothetical protein
MMMWAVWVTDHPPSAIGVEPPDPTRPRNVAGRGRKSDASLIQTHTNREEIGGSGSRGFRTDGWLFEMESTLLARGLLAIYFSIETARPLSARPSLGGGWITNHPALCE